MGNQNIMRSIREGIKIIYRIIIPKGVRKHLSEIKKRRRRKNIKDVDYAVSNEMRFNVIPNKFWNLFNNCEWEPETTNFYRKYVLPTKEIIDIGGWIGPTMMISYSYNPQKIHVVEADPANYQVLKQNIFNNYLNDKVELYNICIGNKSGEIVSFGYNDESIKDTSTKGIGGSRVKVRTITLEDFLKTKDMKNINIIKIDTEGGEEYMEKGLEYISKFANINILLSIHVPFWKNKQETTEMLIEQFKNYDIYTDKEETITENELIEKMRNNNITQYRGKVGLFFTLILKTNINKSNPSLNNR